MLTTLLYPPSCSIYIKVETLRAPATMCANFYFFSFLMSSVVSSHPSTPTTAVCLDISLVSELFPLIVLWLWTFSRHNFNSIICELLNSLDVLVINCCGSSMLKFFSGMFTSENYSIFKIALRPNWGKLLCVCRMCAIESVSRVTYTATRNDSKLLDKSSNDDTLWIESRPFL